MGQTLRCCALALAIFSAASVCKAQVSDCWLLEGSKLDQAREHGLCLDSFARNTRGGVPAGGEQAAAFKGGNKEVAAAPGSIRSTAPSKRKRERSAQTKIAPQDVAETTSWSSPREDVRHDTVDAGVAQAGAHALQYQPPPPTDPVTAFFHGLKHDFDYFVYDLERDFRALGRMITEAGPPRPEPDFRVSER